MNITHNSNQLPKGWVQTNVGNIIEPSDEKAEPNRLKLTRYIGLEHIEKSNGKLLGFGHSNEVNSTKNIFHTGDLLYGRLRPYLNKVYHADFDGICSTDILVFPKQADIHNKFLFYRLLNNDFVEYASRNMSGVQHPRVNYQTLSKFSFLLPPLPEQHRIVAKIEELFTKLDASVDALNNTKLQLKRYRQAVLKYAFEKQITAGWRDKNSIVNWDKLKLGELIRVKSGDGLTRAERQAEGKYHVYGGNGETGKHDKYMFTEPKLIIGRVGVHCGNVHITKPFSWVTDNAFIVDFDNRRVSIEYLRFYMEFLNLNKYSKSTAQPVISGGAIYPIDIEVPSVDEQDMIVEAIDKHFSIADQIEKAIERSIIQAGKLRQGILKKSFEGKLVPQDPTDEPAEKLLERIKAERVSKGVNTKQRRLI